MQSDCSLLFGLKAQKKYFYPKLNFDFIICPCKGVLGKQKDEDNIKESK